VTPKIALADAVRKAITFDEEVGSDKGEEGVNAESSLGSMVDSTLGGSPAPATDAVNEPATEPANDAVEASGQAPDLASSAPITPAAAAKAKVKAYPKMFGKGASSKGA
jgi:hypothetical protein